MPEEQQEAPVQTPAPAPAPAPTPEQAAAPAPAAAPAAPAGQVAAPKKSNGCMIAIIVVAVIIVLAGIGLYVGYRVIKNKVSDTFQSDGNSASVNIGDTKSSVSTSGDTYADVTEQVPTVDLIKNVDKEIKPVFSSTFGGAKTSAWASLDAENGSLTYKTKNKVTAADYAKIKTGLVALGYTSSSDFASSEGSMLYLTKSGITVTVILNTDDTADEIVVSVAKEQAALPTE